MSQHAAVTCAPGGIAQGRDVQPSDTAGAAGGGAVLLADATQVIRQLAEDLGRVRPRAHARRVRFRLRPHPHMRLTHSPGCAVKQLLSWTAAWWAHHADDGAVLAGREAEAACNAANGRVGRCDKRVRPKVQVQHGRIGALHEDAAAALVGVVHKIHGVAHERQHTARYVDIELDVGL